MNIDDIITLDNDARYYIIDNIDFNDVTYYLAVGLFDNDEVDTKDFVFFKHTIEDGEESVEVVDDEQTLLALYALEAENAVLEEDPNGEELVKEFEEKLQEATKTQE